MGFVINIIDSDGKPIPYDRVDKIDTNFDCDIITITLLDARVILHDSEIGLIKNLIEDKLDYGVGITKSRLLIELYDKLDKIEKQKFEENTINE